MHKEALLMRGHLAAAHHALGVTVVVLYGTDYYDEPDISHLWNEIRITGQVFNKIERAAEIADYFESQIE